MASGYEWAGFEARRDFERRQAEEAASWEKQNKALQAANQVLSGTSGFPQFKPPAGTGSLTSFPAPPSPTTIPAYQPLDIPATISAFKESFPAPTTTRVGSPGFTTLRQARKQILQEQQTQAAPGVSKLRQALRHVATVAANEDNPARKKEMLRGIMQGAGTSLADIMGTSYNTALATVGEDVRAANQASAQAFGAKVSQAMQKDAAEFGAWQYALGQALTEMQRSNVLGYEESRRVAMASDTAKMQQWQMGAQLAGQKELVNLQNWQSLYNTALKTYLETVAKS